MVELLTLISLTVLTAVSSRGGQHFFGFFVIASDRRLRDLPDLPNTNFYDMRILQKQ